VKALSKHSPGTLSIRIVFTKTARHFLQGQSAEQPLGSSILHLQNVDGIYDDDSEWGRNSEPWKRGRPILHIELRKCESLFPLASLMCSLLTWFRGWYVDSQIRGQSLHGRLPDGPRATDILVIAPLSMDGLAKIVNGQADSLLYSLVRAWDTDGTVDNAGKKRIIVAPAANSAMWKHPSLSSSFLFLLPCSGLLWSETGWQQWDIVTAKQIKVLEEEWGADNAGKSGWFEVLRPQDDKTLACGDVGIGAMRDWREIVKVIEDRLHLV
jgi:phosphopantothenoylcysteine decarboxylase